MGRRSTLTDSGISNLKPRATRYAFPDPELGGHYIRVTPLGGKSYTVVANDPNSRKQVWATIGPVDLMKIDEAREKARNAIRRIRSGLPAFEAPAIKPETFADVSSNWLKRHVQARGLRSQFEIERMIAKYVAPKWSSRIFASIRRSDVTTLLDSIEDISGASQADAVLAVVRGISNWYATRHEDYVNPFTKGMRRAVATKRERILSDDEIRSIWRGAATGSTFGAILQLALLTAQRRQKIASMTWADLKDDEWSIPRENREKGTGGALLLPEIAMTIISAQPRYASNPYVFPGRGQGHFNGFSPCKRAFDLRLPEMSHWTVHDLRRTARSLMSRVGVRSEIAERVLGHAIDGVKGVYDRHSYRTEKADALKRLAGLVESI